MYCVFSANPIAAFIYNPGCYTVSSALVYFQTASRLCALFYEYDFADRFDTEIIDCLVGARVFVERLLLGGRRMSIRTQDLTVSYNRHPAVHHFDICFDSGSMWAVFGPNGAGKSTFLKAVMGLQKIDTGKVEWCGCERKDIAYLPQQSEIDRSQPMTVFELAALGLWYEIGFFGRVGKAQRARVTQALERVEMADFADRQIGHLSNGQFQRVLFARMLVQDAKYLLLDEPFNAVDAKTTYALLELLRQCNSEGRTVVAVLHDYEQVRAYFPYTVLIAREKIASGKTEDVLTEHFLKQADAAVQKHDAADWCEA